MGMYAIPLIGAFPNINVSPPTDGWWVWTSSRKAFQDGWSPKSGGMILCSLWEGLFQVYQKVISKKGDIGSIFCPIKRRREQQFFMLCLELTHSFASWLLFCELGGEYPEPKRSKQKFLKVWILPNLFQRSWTLWMKSRCYLTKKLVFTKSC